MNENFIIEIGEGGKPNLDDFADSPTPAVTKPRRATESINSLLNNSHNNDDDNDKGENSLAYSQWADVGNKQWVAIPPGKPKLTPGLYNIMLKNGQSIFLEQTINVDDLIKFPDSLSDNILQEIELFWNKGNVFKEYGYLHRRGYLFYGPQGSGKTALVQQIVANIISSGGIIFMCDHPEVLSYGLKIFRTVEPNRPVVCLFEDIDAIVARYGEDSLLSLLDGEHQINKVLNIATTNYPETLDKRLIARPRRFDRIIKIDMPAADIRRSYFMMKLKIKESELDLWVDSTEGFSFAACAELVISVKCLGQDFEKAVDILRELLVKKASSHEFDEPVGFGFGKVKGK